MYILCDILDHRISKSCLNGEEKEEFKCSFRSEILKEAGKMKQWLQCTRIVSNSQMTNKVERALEQREYSTGSSYYESIAKELRIDPVFVRKVAKARKVASYQTNSSHLVKAKKRPQSVRSR